MATDSIEQNSLRLQYQLLQEKQKERLLRLQQKKRHGNKTKENEQLDNEQLVANKGREQSDQLWISNENSLNLKLGTDPEEDKLPNYDDDQIARLRDTIRQLKDENSRFRRLVKDKEAELKLLRKKVEDSKLALAGEGVASEGAASRIVELSKKNRELSSQIGVEKAQSKEISKKFAELNRELDRLKSINLEITNDNKNSESSEIAPDETETLREKLAQTSTKLNDYRSQCQKLKQELKTAQKILYNELGENININNLLNRSSNWRGRQQQIIVLQDKVTELKQQLIELKANDSGRKSGATSIALDFFPTAIDTKHQSAIKKIEKQRREAHEKVTIEFEKLEENYKQLQQKYEGARARNKILSTDLKIVKEQTATLLEKGKHDDEFVEVLLRENSDLKEKKKSDTKVKVEEVVELKQLVSQFKAKCHDKDERIKDLQNDVEKLRSEAKQPSNNRNKVSFRNRPLSASSNSDIASGILPTPPSRPRSDSISSDQHRTNYLPTPNSDRSQNHSRIPITVEQNKGKDLANLQLQLQEQTSLAKTVEIERDRLNELVKILQERIKESTNKCLELTNKFQEQRRLNALLEKELNKIRRQNQPFEKPVNQKKRKNDNISDFEAEIDHLKARLEIQKDENFALKETVQSVCKAKEEDLQLYHQMMEQTKKIFLISLREYKKLSLR